MSKRSVLIAALLSACSSKDNPALCEGAPDAQACFTQHYIAGDTTPQATECGGASSAKIGGRKELVFHYSAAASEIAVQREGRSLQHYYRPYELEFFTRSAARLVSFEHALGGDVDEIAKRAEAKGINANDDAAMTKFAGEAISENLRNFVNAQPKGENLVHVVVLHQVLSPSLAKSIRGSSGGGTIVGLGLSPQLLADAAADDPDKNLFDLFQLPAEFTPVLFVGDGDVVRLTERGLGELVVAHELGHSLGLQHTTDPQNLMFPRLDASKSCRLVLSDDQVASLDALTLRLPTQARPLVPTDGAAHARDAVTVLARAVAAKMR